MNQKNQRGITLIALVVTIIVLLILAGVTINMAIGDDGLIGQVQQTKMEQKEENIKEEAEIFIHEQKLANKNGTSPKNVNNFIDDLVKKSIITEEEGEKLKKGDSLNVGNATFVKDEFVLKSVLNTVKVGDYVEYKYDAPEEGYTTPEVGTGSEVATEQQTFNSTIAENIKNDGKAAIRRWRVLSKKNGIVKLVAETRTVVDLNMGGKLGYLNGPTVLKEMCKVLYSGEMGTATSINVDDVNQLTKYDGTKSYQKKVDGVTVVVSIPKNETKTVGDLENELGVQLTYRNTPDGKEIVEYEANAYEYNPLDSDLLEKTSKEYEVLFGENIDLNYWLASTANYVLFSNNRVNFEMRLVNYGKVTRVPLYYSRDKETTPFAGIRPVVTLKSGLEVDGGTGEKGNPWTIKIVTE